MFVEQLRRAVEASPRVELPKVSALLWKAYAAGTVSESDAADLSTLIEARKAAGARHKGGARRLVGSRPRSPAHMERRRHWAASGCLPPSLAARFTLAEVAVLGVVSAETRKRGDCRLTNGELADVAGVSITTAKNALRAARALGPHLGRGTPPDGLPERFECGADRGCGLAGMVAVGGGGKSAPRS